MAQKKVLVTALQPFSHGNVDARQGGVYAMNAGDAKALSEAGFAALEGSGEPEQTQIDQPPQVKNQGDVVVDDTDEDVLGEKTAQPLDNKMAAASRKK